jgi:hypothetical protein
MTELKPQDYKRRARAYLEVARRACRRDGSVAASYNTPILHLLGHCLELLLKSELLEAGASKREVKKIGHNLKKAWDDERTLKIRDALQESARGIVDIAVYEDLDAQIARLSTFHSADSEYTLRYPNEGPTLELRPPYLLRTLQGVLGGERNRD